MHEQELDLSQVPWSPQKEVVRVFYQQMWDRADTSLVPQLFHPDFTFRGSLGPQLVGYQQFIGYVELVCGALGAYTSDILALVEEGNQVCGKLRFHGFHRGELLGVPLSGRHVWWYGAPVFTFEGERIRDLWVLGDVHGLIRLLKGEDLEGSARAERVAGRQRKANVELRRATVADAAAVAACVCEAYVPYIELIGRQPGPMLQDYAEVIADSLVDVAIRDGHVVGSIVMLETDEGFHIDNVAVRPAVKGTGVGRALLQVAEAEALRRGYASVYLATHERMTENRALYTRAGYVQYDERIVNGYPRVFFRKHLAGSPNDEER